MLFFQDSIYRCRSYPLLTSQIQGFFFLVFYIIFQLVTMKRPLFKGRKMAAQARKNCYPVDKYAVDNLLLTTALNSWNKATRHPGP
jgi:hypothetical protein